MKESVRKKVNDFANHEQSNEQQVEAFHKWYIEDSQIEEKENAFLHLWQGIDVQTDGRAYAELDKFLSNVQQNSVKSANKRISLTQLCFRIASVVLITLLSSYFVTNYFFKDPQSIEFVEVATSLGELKDVTLPDGSTVKLNSGSVILYPTQFAETNRTVHLVGEALFDVQKNEKLPFIVKSNSQNLKVLGTNFNISAYPDSEDIETTLIEGKVELRFDNRAEDYVMHPNEQIVYSKKNNTISKSEIEVNDVLAWTKGQLRFREVNVEEMLLAMERRYNVVFQYNASQLSKDKFNVTFRSETSLEEALSILNYLIGPISYKIDNNNCKLTFYKKANP